MSGLECLSFKDRSFFYEAISKLCASLLFILLLYVCRDIHTYTHVSSSALFTAQISGAIVLILIEYSLWSFQECLLPSFASTVSEGEFFLSISNQICHWDGGNFVLSFHNSSRGLHCTETTWYANVCMLSLRQSSADNMLSRLWAGHTVI